MDKDRPDKTISGSPVDLTDADVFAAMKRMQGFIDITPADFREIYRFAYNHAVDRIATSVTAEDVMTRKVVAVDPDTPLTETAEKMAAHNISGVPVIDADRKIVGVISEKDFLHRMGAQKSASFMAVISDCLKNKGCVALSIRGKIAGDIMSAPAVTVGPERPLSEISALFAEKQINRVPVVDEQGRLIGIVTRGNIVDSYLAKICE